jgi:pimeloyl-ACP methyl ester carboxylesterase
MSYRSMRTTLASGLTLHHVAHGTPGGMPAVLLHGYADSWRAWSPLIEALPDDVHVIAPSQRGHGASDKPDGRYDPATLADDLAGLLDRLEVDRAVVVGHSLGAAVAQRFARAHPRRTLGLVLIGGFASLRGNPEAEALHAAVAELTHPVDPGFVRAFQAGTVATTLPPPFLDLVVAESMRVPLHVWRRALDALLADDTDDPADEIAAPALLLWGDRDTLCPRATQLRLRQAIADSRLITYPGLGHAPHWEAPRQVAADVAAFVDSAVAVPA